MRGTIKKRATAPAHHGRPSLPVWLATALACTVAAVVAAAIASGWLVAEDPPLPVAAAIARPTAPPPPVTEDPRPPQTNATVPSNVDALDAYAAMRDDVNPKARLRLIEDWARQPHPDGDIALLSQALVDPDASVRERAQTLFDRALEHR